jgi:hypothetical protein
MVFLIFMNPSPCTLTIVGGTTYFILLEFQYLAPEAKKLTSGQVLKPRQENQDREQPFYMLHASDLNFKKSFANIIKSFFRHDLLFPQCVTTRLFSETSPYNVTDAGGNIEIQVNARMIHFLSAN